MVQNAEQLGGTNTFAGDPRITPLGRILRKAKLDELPQLINVLRGEMSFVGPRPMPPADVALYDERQRQVLLARPGVTGLTQLRFAHEEELLAQVEDPDRYSEEVLLPAKLESDLEYLRTRSLWSDIKLLLLTPLSVLRRRAY